MVYERVIDEVAKDFLPSENIDSFINNCYNRVFEEKNIDPTNYQARAAITGETFEVCALKIFNYYYDVSLKKGKNFPEIGMSRGGGADFSLSENNKPKCIIEAKGSAKKLKTEDGYIEPNRPGLQRTDTVKKAICQAYQVDRVYPDCLFFLLTSHKPNRETNSKDMLELAEGDIIDGIISIYNKKEIDQMISKIKNQ